MSIVNRWKLKIVSRTLQRAIERRMKGAVMKNWKTTILGILVIVVAVANGGIAILDGDPATNLDIASIIGVITGSGLIVARDAVNKISR